MVTSCVALATDAPVRQGLVQEKGPRCQVGTSICAPHLDAFLVLQISPRWLCCSGKRVKPWRVEELPGAGVAVVALVVEEPYR